MLTRLKEVFEFNTFQHKIKSEDITLRFENGEPVFNAIVCIAGRTEQAIKKGTYEKEFTDRDVEKILKLKELENEWWKVEIKKEYVWLYYYPMGWKKTKHLNVNDVYEKLNQVEEQFTRMVSRR